MFSIKFSEKLFALLVLLLIFNGCSSTEQIPGGQDMNLEYTEVPVPDNFISEEYPRPDVWAKYPGGQERLQYYLGANSLFFLSKAIRKGVKGRVIITYVVGVDGSIKDIQAQMSPSDSITKKYEELILNMDKWKPALIDGKPVEQRYIFVARIGGELPERIEVEIQQN